MISKRKLSFLACFSAWMVVIAALSNCYCAPPVESPVKAALSHCKQHAAGSGTEESGRSDCAPRYLVDQFENAPALSLKVFLTQTDSFQADAAFFDIKLSSAFFEQSDEWRLVADSPPAFYLLHHAFLI